MQYIILAAGKSSRIFFKIKKNKCLLEINKITLIEKILKNIEYVNKKQKNIFIITGFKQHLIKKKLVHKKNIKYLFNKKYKSTEMLHSMIFGLQQTPLDDTMVIYSDIIFSKILLKKIISINSEKVLLPVLENWKKIWFKKDKNIFEDAETLVIDEKKNLISEIGNKIVSFEKIPNYQYMGLIYLPKKKIKKILTFYKMRNFKNFQITKFLNILIKDKILKIKPIKTKSFWYEFDDFDDYENFIK